MAARDRMFVSCKCGKSEIILPADDGPMYITIDPNMQCCRCWNTLSYEVRREPDWPKLLRGL